MAPIQWDGILAQSGNFSYWWNEVMEAAKRKQGQSHIELTTNILWQIWKARNEWQYNSKQKHLLKIAHKAQKDWQEQVLAKEKQEPMTNFETSKGPMQDVQA